MSNRNGQIETVAPEIVREPRKSKRLGQSVQDHAGEQGKRIRKSSLSFGKHTIKIKIRKGRR